MFTCIENVIETHLLTWADVYNNAKFKREILKT